MPTPSAARDLILGISPLRQPNADLVVAVERAGYLGVLDLGPDSGAARAALERVRQRLGGSPFGVRISEGDGFEATGLSLPPGVDTILLDPVLCDSPWPTMSTARVLAEVTSAEEAEKALRHGAYGLVAHGFEAAGRIGELSTFVLVQRLIAAFPGVPVWAMGGIGPHTAAAAVAGGARGVAVDAQLALVAEAGLPAEVAAAIAAMDGSETRVIGGRRVYARPGRPDMRTELHVGQDGAFAAPLAARYKTAGGVTRAIGAAITTQVELAARIEPLRDAVPVQGPMTRVSDRAEFAAAVADGGGLPFLALALMSEEQVAELLAKTGALLGGTPWGVGILGFAPREVREAQLAAILRARPPYALIAGGRPAQAAALQDAGIETFLHVPSPVLLDQFLASGARRFVFEGAECGGHIGPRGSFALWEAQVARLLEQPDLDGVHAWFAGGVHDERSAAMVAALAAPLAERGARVSVLMGTAYLFTGEVVESGAVVPLYQRTARECHGTALLESAPGHVVRCADTPYVAAFGAAKDHLSKSGMTQQEAWAELERFSLGRLRVAAKGMRRDDDALVTVDEQGALANGMFMLGQVATLHSEMTTIAALHDQVTLGATSLLAGRAAELRGLRNTAEDAARTRPLDVAIIGMACVYPGADGLESYWSNVVAGTDAVGDVPQQRWQKERYPTVPSARGGFIPPVSFDALAYGIPPSALASIEPVQLLALKVAARALADAGYATRPFDRSRASVIFGAEPGSDLSAAYGLRSALPAYLGPASLEPASLDPASPGPGGAGRLPAELDEYLPRLTEDSFPGVLGNVIAGRIANRLDLGGANYCVDAACASSLAALDLACKELAAGTSDLVLCGGADTHNGIHDYEMFASVHALSPNGRCATFDARADGIALGEGVGCLVLKRLADAERDGDRIYAVVGGIGASSDGRSLGLTAPRPEGQRLALERAYAMAGLSPAEVGLIEAHGTGTVAGDRAELATLTAVFTSASAEPGSCVVGSVKSQIGHTKCAAGLAGLIKVACALHTGTRPGTIHLSEPNAFWDPATSPFTFGKGTARPWPTAPGQRHAGVSAFGFGGTNFHAVLSGYDGADEPSHGLLDWPAELFVLRGDVAEAARQLAELAAANDEASRPWRLAQLAATMAARPGPVRAAFVADSLDDLRQRLREPLPREPLPRETGTPGAVAFLFPGQGSQRPGMAADLLTAFPRLQRLLRLAGRRLAAAMFPPAAFNRADRERHAAAITDTRIAQPALGVADLATWELLTMTGVRPDMAAGHSYGELAALCAAGVYDAATLLRLSAARAEAILAAAGDDPGAMASVTADPATVAALLGGTGVVIANHNAPDQVVISGATAAVEAAVAALTAAGVPARGLDVACAFHSPLVAPAAAALTETLASQAIATPRFPVYANSTATPYPHAPADVRRLLAAQVADQVRFAEQVEAMYAAGARTFVEVGPGRVLTGLVARILGDRPHTAVACDVPGDNGLRRFLSALAELISAGVPVDPCPLFAGRVGPVTGTPPRAPWTVDGQVVRTADGKPVAGGLRPATEAPRLPLSADTAAGSASPASAVTDRERVVAEFLRTARELIAAQRDVVLGYLGTAPLPPAASFSSLIQEHADPERMRFPLDRQPPAPPAASAETVPGAAHSPGAAPAASAIAPGPAEIGAAVVAVISARTGYPPDMLGADLDLEADLSIDSIKRTEIVAALAGRLGLATTGVGIDERLMEELSLIKTVSGITDWLAGHLATDSASGPVAVHPSAVPIPADLASASPTSLLPADPMPLSPAPVSLTPAVPLSADPLSAAQQAAAQALAASEPVRLAPDSGASASSVPRSLSADGVLADPGSASSVPRSLSADGVLADPGSASSVPRSLSADGVLADPGSASSVPRSLSADGVLADPGSASSVPRSLSADGVLADPGSASSVPRSLSADGVLADPGSPRSVSADGASADPGPPRSLSADGASANPMSPHSLSPDGASADLGSPRSLSPDGVSADPGSPHSLSPDDMSADPGSVRSVAAARTSGRPRAARPRRFLVEPVLLPPAGKGHGLAPRGRFLIIDDGRGIALELADLLEQRGADAIIAETPSGGELASTDALVHLGALRPGGRPVLPAAFGLIRDALAARVHTVLVATAGGGAPGRDAGSETLGDAPRDLAADGHALLGWAFGDGPGDTGTGNHQMGSNGTGNSRAGNGRASNHGTDNGQTGNHGTGDNRTDNNWTGNSQMGDSQRGDSQTGYNGSGNSRTGDDHADNHGTGDNRPGNHGTGDNRTGDNRPGNHGTGDNRTDNNWTGNSRTGDNWTGDSRTGDSQTGYDGSGNSRTGDSHAGNGGTGHSRTGDNRPGNHGTGDSRTGDNGTGSGAGRGWDEEPCDLGLRGLIRTLAAEYPGVLARAVDVEPKDSPRQIAAQLLAELADSAGPAVVGYQAGRRTGLHLVEVQALPARAATGLDRDSVVLLTGGARGITASVALALARAAGCHIELIGRTPPPRPVDPELDAADPVALRHILVSRGLGGPREIEAEAGRLLRERQVRATLDGLRAVSASVRYHVADVRDAAAVGAVLADVYARFGRLDGVIHGAGVLEDRLIAEKTPASFARVYGTKVDGARALAAGLRGDLRFLVLFGSVSGVLGNRGQADYAAANDALDALARHWSLRAGRVVTIDWGPWADGGMVSPELERVYARRGVTLIDPDEGVACLLAELAEPTGTAPAQVVYLCGDVPMPSVMGTAGD